jgi:thymidylate synthase
MSGVNSEELQYLNLIQKILDRGTLEKGRNGNTISTFGESMRFSLENGKIPILTTKKTAWKTCLKELLWFIRGETDNKILQQQGVHIWDGNTTREFLDSRGLTLYPEGMAGPIYGYQWRDFGAIYNCFTGKSLNADHPFDGIDQLQQIIDQLKNPETRNSRRLILTAWNPKQLDQMALPPCHVMCQFNVHDGNKLSCALYQRSSDFFLGIPFNIASTSLLVHIIAKLTNLNVGTVNLIIGDYHIYKNHLDAILEQLSRIPFDLPSLELPNFSTLEQVEQSTYTDYKIINYQCNTHIKADMIA